VPTLDRILEKLTSSQQRLLQSADAVPAHHWKTRPQRDKWSAAELVAHLILVERSVVGTADRIAQKTPKRFSFFQRLHLPIRIVEARVIRQKAPPAVTPEALEEKETMLASLREMRERTLAFLEETKSRNLAQYRWRHPFLGSFDMYEWFQFVAAHQARHEKQMREIAEGLPKPISDLKKLQK
jgi:hypothetical protein